MQYFDHVLKNGNVFLDTGNIEKLDIGILDGKINFLGNIAINKAKKITDLKNLLVLPGCIDSQVHFREPGLTHKEDLESGTKSAVLGGITSIFEMPNTNPSTTTKKALEEKLRIAKKKAICNYSFFIGAAKENIKIIDKLEKLKGCCGIKIFMGSSTGDLLVEDDDSLRGILSNGSRRIAVHSEDEYRLRDRKSILNNVNIRVHDHEVWRDTMSALQSTIRLIKIAREVSRKIHILHISTSDEIDVIAKNKDLITAEANPQHLFFHSPDCYDKLGSLSQMNPPIRNKSHQDGLWVGIQNRIIDVVGSDHAPHTLHEKQQKYPESPSGMTGVQTLVPIMLDFVNKEKITIKDFVRLTSSNPSKIYGIKNKGFIKIGYDADLTIIDLNKINEIKNNWIASKSKWTPYDGIKVKGWPIFTIINGEVAMRNDELISKNHGKEIQFSYN